ncbi:glycoside hydrolase family 3 protein [Coleophoma crateriformis]|uniref:xylan 1,4-beta-xylosidase n=1 Tax=Coleophoma crateriformis TaxID=565419 RepID=A0A3D8QI79_9HELO|nr:glycoside hydrolase family 3 protein [Coleophoma crateriformis]
MVRTTVVRWLAASSLLSSTHAFLESQSVFQESNSYAPRLKDSTAKDSFLDNIVANMTIPELAMQLHLMFAGNIIGPNADNEMFDFATRFAPEAGVGVLHDLYATNSSQYNSLQKLSIEKSRLDVPFLQFGECLHGVGSYKQSMFPQNIGMAASFDTDLVHRVGRAIGSEARSIGIHACLAPVLDLGLEPRWGRVQEAWGEDMLLTSKMGVAMASGMSKNGSWADPDAVAPVVKHFAAHGSLQGGINGAPSMVLGTRQVMENMLRPFKAVMDLGGVRGVMMAYSELDGSPSHINPMLYEALEDWGFDGFVTADDTGIAMLQYRHATAASPGEAIKQWFNAGGMIQYYDYSVDTFLNATIDLVNNGSVAISTLQSHVRKILDVKYDLGLFENPYIPDEIDSQSLTATNVPLTLEAAQKSIVLLENRNQTLPIKPTAQGIRKLALIGPFGDTLNYGDYSGAYGAYPVSKSSTIRQAISEYLKANASGVELVSSWGVNDWYFNAQRNIPGYLLSTPDGKSGGLLGTYYTDTEFKEAIFQKVEAPNRDWGLFPPNGLPSTNFSVIWEGLLTVPVDGEVEGWIGVALSANTTAKLYIDDELVQHTEMSTESYIQSNIPGIGFTAVNSTSAPAGGTAFTYSPGKVHKIRLEYQVYNLAQKMENSFSLNAEIELFWNLVDQKNPIQKALDIAADADVIILAVGANWDSDGEGGDRATLDLSKNQTELSDAIFALGKPVVMVLQGGRPFAIPEYYAQASAVLNAYFPGQSGGQAISDVLFGVFNPGARIPVSVPRSVGTLPVFYNYKPTARFRVYTDEPWAPVYSFGYGLSYTTFRTSALSISSSSDTTTFSDGDTLFFSVDVTNTGELAGSYLAQVYLLGRRSTTTRPVKQLMAFQRVYLEPGEERTVVMELEVDRYMPVVNLAWQWELEKGEYVFALLEHSGFDADTGINATMVCI